MHRQWFSDRLAVYVMRPLRTRIPMEARWDEIIQRTNRLILNRIRQRKAGPIASMDGDELIFLWKRVQIPEEHRRPELAKDGTLWNLVIWDLQVERPVISLFRGNDPTTDPRFVESDDWDSPRTVFKYST